MTEPTCTLCDHGTEHGWWGVNGVTHCRGCHATWRMGTKVTHCVTCHATFSTPANCDRHQKGTKSEPWGCRPPADRGLIPTENTFGVVVWALPGDPERFTSVRQSASGEGCATPMAQDREMGLPGLAPQGAA